MTNICFTCNLREGVVRVWEMDGDRLLCSLCVKDGMVVYAPYALWTRDGRVVVRRA